VKPVTQFIARNEKAMSLREENLHGRRYQIIVVVRADELTEWWKDLGPSGNHLGDGFQIPSLMEHTVAELQDIATASRHDDTWQKEMRGVVAESTLISDFLSQYEERSRIINNKSSFGPGVVKQRNGFSKGAVNGSHA
jgi:hypothetical protein